MKKKALILGALFISLIFMTFATPIIAQCDKPDFALDEEDLPGWTLLNETCISIDTTDPFTGQPITVTMWSQVWTDNASWIEATKAIMVITVDLGLDFNQEIPGMGMTMWDAMVQSFSGTFPVEEVTDTGLDHCVLWNATNVWFALGHKGSVLVMAGGWNSPAPSSGFLIKTPTEESATKEDLINVMKAQGAEFPGGIPAFDFIFIAMSLVILASIVFLLRKQEYCFVSPS